MIFAVWVAKEKLKCTSIEFLCWIYRFFDWSFVECHQFLPLAHIVDVQKGWLYSSAIVWLINLMSLNINLFWWMEGILLLEYPLINFVVKENDDTTYKLVWFGHFFQDLYWTRMTIVSQDLIYTSRSFSTSVDFIYTAQRFVHIVYLYLRYELWKLNQDLLSSSL